MSYTYERDPEERKKYNKEYYERNKDKIKEYKKWYFQETKELRYEKINEYRRKKYQEDEEYRLKNREKCNKYKEENRDKIIKCECGCDVRKFTMPSHKKSNKHLKLLKDQKDKKT